MAYFLIYKFFSIQTMNKKRIKIINKLVTAGCTTGSLHFEVPTIIKCKSQPLLPRKLYLIIKITINSLNNTNNITYNYTCQVIFLFFL